MAKENPGKYLPAILVFLAVVYAGVLGRLDVLVLAAGIGLICMGLKLPVENTLIAVAAAAFLGSYLSFGGPQEIILQKMAVRENFANNDDQDGAVDNEFFANNDRQDGAVDNDFFANDDSEENFDEEEFDNDSVDGDNFEDEAFEEGFANEDKPKKKKKAKKVNPPPDHGDRAEPLVLGKKYKMPSEDDDEDYHLDAGTTFLNAYKSLNPEQISAMTKDTQDLINTQKQLMSTLNTLKPLITDGKQMMETFGSFMGGQDGAAGLGDLSKMAEKFTSGGK